MLKSIYQKADGTTVQKTFASVQQSLVTQNTHPNPSPNTRADHSDNHEGAETSPMPEEVNMEEISIHFLRTYSIHPNWKQIISSCNDYGQTIAHISVTLGYLRLLRHLFTWEIDLNVVDHMGLTALHYAYLFKQEECAKFLIHSGVDQFILDDLGRSPSDLDPSLEVGVHPIMDIDSDSHAEGASPIEYDTEMPDEAGKLYAKHFLVQQWMRQGEDERRGDVPPSRCQSLEPLGPPRSAGSPPVLDSADESDWGVMYDRFSSLVVHVPKENSPLIVTEEVNSEPPIAIAVPPVNTLPSSPIPEVSAQAQAANDIGKNPFPHPTPFGGADCIITPGGF
jgi:ankyrin repeat protein